MNDIIRNKEYAETLRRQIEVANPSINAFVSANAGSGKTRVLTDRVIRLLLANNPPDKILCITFTKAAAAEMASRLFSILGTWSLLDDDALSLALKQLLGEELSLKPEQLAASRKLFAQALETPGGLKILTIHAFCENILRRFPVECGIAPGFTVMGEDDAALLQQTIIENFAASLPQRNHQVRAAFDILSSQMSEEDLTKSLLTMAKNFSPLQAQLGTPPNFGYLSAYYGDQPEKTEAENQANYFTLYDKAPINQFIDALRKHAGTQNDKQRAYLEQSLAKTDDESRWSLLQKIFLTGAGSLRKNLFTANCAKEFPELSETFIQLQKTFIACEENFRAMAAYDTMRHLYSLAQEIAGDYFQRKNALGLLDFDDLITATKKLFANHIDWVMYKLDSGLSHILLDEAQDTNADQWHVITPLIREFCAGIGRTSSPRTAFVVGDEKQSIFSFQGAEVALFTHYQEWLAESSAQAQIGFANPTLNHSFRSTVPVLRFVDQVFTEEAAKAGVCPSKTLNHTAARAKTPGRVGLWPLAWREKEDPGRPWDLPLDSPDKKDPADKLAAEIAKTLKDWIHTRLLPARGRVIEPGDILILCQRRGKFFHAMIRELSRLAIPSSGSDRLKLLEDVAVKDLLSLMRFCVQPADDLSLAELLKSPFFAFDDAQLTAIAAERGHKTLWHSLKNSPYTDTISRLRFYKSISTKRGPYALLSAFLNEGTPTGWQRLYKRIGATSNEAVQEILNEALGFEAKNQRSTLAFLNYCLGLEKEIKKELESDNDLVRVMTVHGSKGLQAPIVFLADASFIPKNKHSKLFFTPDKAPIYHPPKKKLPTAFEAHNEVIEQQKREEYNRLLYVGLTRAADELYICGHTDHSTSPEAWLERQEKKNSASWYYLCHRAMTALESQNEKITKAPIIDNAEPMLIFENDQTPMPHKPSENEPDADVPLPPWLHENCPPEKSPLFYSPSLDQSQPDPTPVVAPTISTDKTQSLSPRLRGVVMHELLERLPAFSPAERPRLGKTIIDHHHPNLPPSEAKAYLDEVLRVMADPMLAPLFSDTALAEASIAGTVVVAGKPIAFSGKIDRLHITDDQVLIVDYKTNRPPPETADDIPAVYLAQMAAYKALLQPLYPTHTITAFLLWTWTGVLMQVPDNMMEKALERAFSGVGPD